MNTPKITWAAILAVFNACFLSAAQGQPVSDDFDKASLNASLWSWTDPVGDCQVAVSGYGTSDIVLQMTVPAGSNHDPWTPNNAPRLLQSPPNADFEIVAKFETIPALENQQEGFLVYDPSGTNFLRFSLQYQSAKLGAFLLKIQNNNGTTLAGGTFEISLSTLAAPSDGSNNGTAYLKLNRTGDIWTFSVSPDAVTWETVYQPVQQAWTVASLGPYAGDTGSGYTAILDYFFNTASPIVKEDGQNALPSVTLVSPSAETNLIAPASLVLQANASDPDGTISKIEFYADGTLLGSATAPPYTFTWNVSTQGLHAVTAKATDNSGSTTQSSAVTVLVSGSGGLPVSDDFSKAQLNATLWSTVDPSGLGGFKTVGAGSGNADLQIAVPGGANHDPWIDNQGLLVVQPIPNENFQIEAKFDTLPNTASQEEGFIVQDDAGDFLRFDVLNDGSAQLQAFVGAIINGGGAQVSRTPIKDVPVPQVGNIGTILLRLRRLGDQWTYSTSPDGKVWTVQSSFTQAFGLPVTHAGLLAGNNDPSGAANPPAFTVLVDYFFNTLSPIALEDGQGANTPPIVNITGPADQAFYMAPADITLTADASDSDGTISKVDFYAGTNLLGTATTAPFKFAWHVSSSGIYSVGATATDNGGAVKTASPVTVLVGGTGLLPVSDDFNSPAINSVWTTVNPVGDGSFQTIGANSGDAQLEIIVPTGNEHDGWTANNMLRLLQPALDQDFEIEAKFDSLPPTTGSSSLFEGISVEDANGAGLR